MIENQILPDLTGNESYAQPLNVISLGAGKQSSYMLLQALEGKFQYKPDFAIISDTGCEPKYVYEYLDWLKGYVKEKYNFEIITVSAGNILHDTLEYVNGKRNRVAQLPLKLGITKKTIKIHDEDENEDYKITIKSGGIVQRQCTFDYKIAPLRRYLQQVRNGRKVRLWIGISLDEMERMKDSNVKYIEHYYPLVFNQIRIDQIVNWFKVEGLKEPGKSACLICPFHSDQYWRRFKKEFPIEFETACSFDDAIRNYPKLKSETFLSNHRKPLREIDFTYSPSLFPELIEECDGLCGL